MRKLPNSCAGGGGKFRRIVAAFLAEKGLPFANVLQFGLIGWMKRKTPRGTEAGTAKEQITDVTNLVSDGAIRGRGHSTLVFLALGVKSYWDHPSRWFGCGSDDPGKMVVFTTMTNCNIDKILSPAERIGSPVPFAENFQLDGNSRSKTKVITQSDKQQQRQPISPEIGVNKQ